MTSLTRLNSNEVLVPQLEVAKDFYSRGKGLLGRTRLDSGSGLWIHHCNSIHTYFMKFSIDCVFVNSKLVVTSIKEDVRPWRLVLPQWSARSVFELPAGEVKKLNLKVGDKLHVVT